jgi:MYXO-CTERM domain-containing protein
MERLRRLLLALALSSPCWAHAAHAQRVDPAITRPRVLPERPVADGTIPAPVARRTPVLVELVPEATRLSPDPVVALDALPDVEVVRAHGELVLVRVGAVGAASLAASRLVLRAHDARTSRPWLPLERTRELLRLDAAWARAYPDRAMREGYTGTGVTIADVDTAIDVFHPAFFRGDAGWVSWIDLDGDGELTPGTDAIDLDGDGLLGEGEVARLLRAAPLDLGSGPVGDVRRAGFDPAFDWLYLDENGNGRRDTALELDVTDATPALGEPLFTPDDADRDGVLGPHERLVRLGSSKVARALVDLVGPRIPFRREYVRGTDLRFLRRDYTGGIFGYADTLHGTGVAGILAGDLPLVGRRWVGIAPDAELLSAFYWGDTQSEPVMWALENGADVVLHEYVNWTREALDGGDALGLVIDSSTAEGAVHVCPAGNIGGAQKHVRASLAAGAPVELPIDVPGSVVYWEGTLHALEAVGLRARLREPGGTETDLEAGAMVTLVGGATLYVDRRTTSRGRDVLAFVVASGSTAPVTAGRHTLIVEAATAGVLDAFVSDTSSGFALGVAFPSDLATDASTVSWPSTSDACTSVGAVPAYLESEGSWARGGPEDTNAVRAYSSRGPRIDGDQRVHVVAPDNPWSTLGAGEVFPQYPGYLVAPEGSFQIFGGTSGAGPHVAGVAALVVETGLRGATVRERIMATAWDDALGGPLPDPDYGAGRLDALRAVVGSEPVDNGGGPPRVTLEASPPAIDPGGTVTLTAAAVDPEGSPVVLRWDEGYDGTWEGDYADATTRTWTPTVSGAGGWAYAKVRARDVYGRVGEATVRVRVGEPPTPAFDAGTPDAGLVAEDAAAGLDAGPAPAGGGCGCRTGAPGGRSASAFAALLALAAGLARRRRTRV